MRAVRCAAVFISLLLLAPAAAQAKSVPLGQDLIFRADSGLTKAEYFLAKGKYSAAIDTATDVLKRHTHNADAYTYRGLAYLRLGQTDTAIKNFQRALQVDGYHLGANSYLGEAFLTKGDIGRAIEQRAVLHAACGRATDCPELDALSRDIDAAGGGR